MIGRLSHDALAAPVVLDPQKLYGADNLQSPGVRGQGWQSLPQDPQTQLRKAANVQNMAPYHVVGQAAPLNAQTGLIGRIRSRYTFLPAGKAAQAPQSSA